MIVLVMDGCMPASMSLLSQWLNTFSGVCVGRLDLWIIFILVLLLVYLTIVWSIFGQFTYCSSSLSAPP